MPVVTVTLIEGYDDATRQAMARRLTDAVRATINAPLDGVTVIINEVAPTGYMRGRQSRTPGPAPTPPAELAVRFLRAMEARDLETAGSLAVEGFEMTFPGGVVMTRLEDLVAWSKDRYRDVVKTFERIDEAPDQDGVAVYCQGTLSGKWLDGAEFAGIRFVDRFTVRAGRIVDQKVWNDMGEHRYRVAQTG